MTHRMPSAAGGFTLVEVLVVVAILGVLLGVSAPGLQEYIRSSRLSAATYGLLAEVNLARSEAIKRGSRMVLCKSADGETCTASGGWEQGWIVFHDANNNAARDEGETLVRRHEGDPERLRITGNELVARYLSFDEFGGARLTGGAFQAGTITLCGTSAASTDARLLVINSVGRPRIQRATVESCS